MPPVRQKPRVAMEFLPGSVWFRDRHRCATVGRCAQKPGPGVASAEENSAVAVPRAVESWPACSGQIAHVLWRTAGHVDFLQLARGEEANEATVRRPECTADTFGPGQYARFVLVEAPDGQSHPL